MAIDTDKLRKQLIKIFAYYTNESTHEKAMKMAKEMKPTKKANGGMVRGTGAAITGKGFKGVF